MNRRFIYYKKKELLHKCVIANPPKMLFFQEEDWTCSIACIRTLLSSLESNVPKEIEFIEKFDLTPGPIFSREIKDKRILADYDVIYGCDKTRFGFDELLELLENGYYVMIESMYNYSHWFVLLGYYPCWNEDIEKSRILVFDPYYNETRLLNTDEFISMWIDGDFENTKVIHDFIAIC